MNIITKRFKMSSDYSRVFASLEKNLHKNVLMLLRKYPQMARSEAYKIVGDISKEVANYY